MVYLELGPITTGADQASQLTKFRHFGACIFFAALLFNSIADRGYAAILWKTEEIDVSFEASGQAIKAEFEFINNSDAVVQIEEIKSSCGCVAIQPSASSIAAHGTGVIFALVKASTDLELQRKHILVKFENKDEPYKLTVNIVSKRRFDMLPKDIKWFKDGTLDPIRVSISARSDAVIKKIEFFDVPARFKVWVNEIAVGSRFEAVVKPIGVDSAFKDVLNLQVDFGDGHSERAFIRTQIEK